MSTSSTRSHTSTITSTLSTSTQILSSRESEMSPSTEDQELSSRALEFLIGLLLPRAAAGNTMHTPERHGTTHFRTWLQSQHQHNSLEKDKSLTLSNGSDSSRLERVLLQDSSTTRLHTPHGSETEVTSRVRTSTHSQKLSRKRNSSSVWTLQQLRAEKYLRRNGKTWQPSSQSFSQRMIWSSPTKSRTSALSLTSEDSGNSTENRHSELDLPSLRRRTTLLLRMPQPPAVSFL